MSDLANILAAEDTRVKICMIQVKILRNIDDMFEDKFMNISKNFNKNKI
jgi:hypothetical protein